ncbi:MAG: ferrous iron transporter B [Clostridia bacterium]|nr:ferrous iron transporter B [Clostridia bacterium]
MLKIHAVKRRRAAEAATYTVVLAGNPNAGKTTLFNAVTKSRLKTGNFHGVTTVPAQKQVGDIMFIDVPGMYSFNSYTMEEDSAAEAARQADLIVNVVDSLTLENSLNLTRRLIALNPNTVIYLTKLDNLKRRKGWLDAEKLSHLFGVPVFTSLKELKQAVSSRRFAKPEKNLKIALNEAYYGGNCNLNKAEKLFYNKFFALFFFIFSLIFTFFITFYPNMPGALLKDGLNWLICEKLTGALASAIRNEMLSSFVCEGIVGGVGGVLTFIPQIAILYLVLILLDESGVSSALTFVTDGLFDKVGLSGRAAFSLVSGFGCTAAAIATTRGYREESSRRRTVAVLPFIPCGAKMPVFLTFLSPLFKNPFPAVCVLYFAGVAVAILSCAIIKGKREEQISEITPVSIPKLAIVLKKLFFQLLSFIIKVSTYIFLFCIISWLLSHLSFTRGFCDPEYSILGVVSKGICYLFYPMGITDWRIAYAALTGFAAKENVAATIALLIPEGLSLGLAPSIALCVFFLFCPACISAFAASVKEIGFKRTLFYNAVQLALAFLAAFTVYLTVSLI